MAAIDELRASAREVLHLLADTDVARDERIGHALDRLDQLANRRDDCGPYTCAFPPAAGSRPGDRWTCPACGTHYRLSRRRPARPWRRTYASHGAWRVDLTGWTEDLNG